MHQLYSSIKFYPFFILLYLNSCNNQTSENPSNIKPSPNLISFESLNQNSTKLADKNFELIDNSYSGINFKFGARGPRLRKALGRTLFMFSEGIENYRKKIKTQREIKQQTKT